jgi:hypothetical protein
MGLKKYHGPHLDAELERTFNKWIQFTSNGATLEQKQVVLNGVGGIYRIMDNLSDPDDDIYRMRLDERQAIIDGVNTKLKLEAVA